MKLSTYLLPFFLTLSVILIGCKPASDDESEKTHVVPIERLFEGYYQFKMRLNPIEGTKAGMAEYDHVLANYISKEFQKHSITQYTNFLNAANIYDESADQR